MATTLILIELLVVLVFIFIGARVGGVGLGIYGMLGTFILVYVFGLAPGKSPETSWAWRPRQSGQKTRPA